MRLIMIRHPKTEANEKKMVYGWTDSLYSQEGKATIPGIVRGLHDVKIDRIYSSPLTRTRLLAEAIAADHGPAAPDIVMDDRIKEMNFGKFENMAIPELEEKYPVEFSEYRKNFNDCVVPGGESFRQLSERTVAFLQDIYDRHEKGIDYCKDDDGWPTQGTV
ncbi:MAG: histidine phosphatase family protein, partial [Firmicutes bacterium]|nr:histidine phosphatase family protein [Bacillota bacterium]